MGTKRKRSSQNPSNSGPPPKKQYKSQVNPPANVEKKKQSKAPSKPSIQLPLDNSPFVNDPKGASLKREVQLYDILSSEDVSERINAASAIISGLLDGEGVEESTLQRHLERRLFRGLASGRKAARLGFSVVITEILGQLYGEKDLAKEKYPGLSLDKVLGFLVAKTKPDGDLSGQEEKDHHFGLLFGLQSFVRAKILFEDEKRWVVILDKLLELAKKKPWIREECGWVIVEALAQTNEAQTINTLEKLVDAGLALSPEGVGIWLTARRRFPKTKLPTKPWGKSGNPVDNLQSLAKALKESSSLEESKVKSQQVKSGSWNPKLHFVWDLVLSQYSSGERTASDFEHFWKVAVDDNLFAATASRERKYWGFLVLQKVLQDPSSYGKFFGSIFSHNLLRCIINHVQQEDRFLNRAADRALQSLVDAIEQEPALLPIVLPRLLSGHGAYNFDKITKTKTIEKLLGLVDDDNTDSVIQILVEPVRVLTGDEVKNAESRRLTLGEYLLTIIRKVDTSNEFVEAKRVKAALSAITTIAYTEATSFEPSLSEKTRTQFKNRLTSAFTHLLADLNAFVYPYELLQTLNPSAVPMEEGLAATKDKALSTVDKVVKRIAKAKGDSKSPLQALALLYSLVIFQLYNGEPEAVSVLDELKLCYDKLIRRKETEDDVEASEVLVELLLSFISKPSALLRKVSEHVFAAFMSEMTEGGLKLMTDVLASDESLKGQQALFDQEPEDANDMDVDDGDEDEDMDSDVEVVDMDGEVGPLNGHLDQSEDEGEGDDDDDEEIEDDEDDEEGKKLDAALALALGTHKIDADAEEESDSDADMTDSEMMALDKKLVEIFSQRKKAPSKKQEQKDAKETMVNFKSRLLDLLEIFVKKNASSSLAFGLLQPLLQLIRTTKTKQLAERSHGIISSFAKASKSIKAPESSVLDQLKLLRVIHLEAAKDQSHLYSKAVTTASLLIASSIYRTDEGALKKIANTYRDTQVSWVEGEIKMQASFFVEWVNWCQSHATRTKSS